MWFDPLPEQGDSYVDLAGKEYDMKDLTLETREALIELIRYFNWAPPYAQFKTYWRDESSPIGAYIRPGDPHSKLLRTIARDMEKRLGVAQGRLEA